MHIFCEYLHGKILQFNPNYEATMKELSVKQLFTSKTLCILSFHKKIIVKNNNFATQKWRILRPGRIA